MKDLNWTIESDVFQADTPVFGELEFENIIAKLNPNARRYLALACHFDSKYTRERDFIGATDSAVPCAQLINLATVMSKYLTKQVSHAEHFEKSTIHVRNFGKSVLIFFSKMLAWCLFFIFFSRMLA